MSSGGIIAIDTKPFDEAIAAKGELVSAYDDINNRYIEIINRLNQNWDGQGAEAFEADATRIRENIGGIYDTLKIMSDTLTDVREIIAYADRAVGDANRDPLKEG